MNDTQAAIERLRTALEASTPGTWINPLLPGKVFLNDGELTEVGEAYTNDADATLWIAAHNDLPALLAEVERLQDYVAMLNGQNERYRQNIAEITGIPEDDLMPAGAALYEQLHDHWLPTVKRD